MAGRLTRPLVQLLGAWLLVVAGCAEGVVGMEETLTPLATVRVRLAPGTDVSDLQRPRVGLVWGGQTLAEPTCWLAALGLAGDAQAVAEVGCRDPLGFYPEEAGVSVPLQADGTAEIPLYALPSADWMVGDLTARLTYASVVLFDDGDGDQSLNLRFPWWGRGRAWVPAELRDEADFGGGGGGGGDGPPQSQDDDDEGERDTIHAASFVSMTRPDVRLSFREGGFDAVSAYYPRVGCEAPPVGYSLVGSGGFDAATAVLAFGKGELPQASDCFATTLQAGVVELARESTRTLTPVGCVRGNSSGSNGAPRYREPPETAPWIPYATWACLPLGAAGSGILGAAGNPGSGKPAGDGRGAGDAPETKADDLVVAYPLESCPALRHYTLRGCRNDPRCEVPEWDLTETPPSWWPCDGHVPEEATP